MFTISRETEITTKLIKTIIIAHKTLITGYLAKQLNYRGAQKILVRTMNDSTKPNNKLVNAFPAYIVNVNTGYFMGKPVTYSAPDEDKTYIEKLQEIFDDNKEQNENTELAKEASIKGVSYELLYINEESEIKFNKVSPENMILVYDTKITPEPYFALRTYTTSDNLMYVELYEAKSITLYKTSQGGALTLQNTMENIFKDIPVVEVLNNDESQGDFDKVLTLINEYDKAQSDTANDFEYFTSAYLHLHNLYLDKDDLLKLKEKRVIETRGENGRVEWIIKDIQDEATENFKTRMQEDIHRFSNTPNLTDESFAGNLTGVALSYKLLGMEWNCSTKERKFKTALQRRIALINKFLDIKGSLYDWRDIKITFTRNLPQNEAEIIETLIKLAGRISEKTFISQIPFIEDPEKEIEQMDKEAEAINKAAAARGEVNLDDTADIQETGSANSE